MSYSSIWPIDKILSGAIIQGQSRPGSNGNEGKLHKPQKSWTGPSPRDCLLSYLGHSLGGGVLPLWVNVMHQYSHCLGEFTFYFIRSDFHMIDNQSITVQVFALRILILLSVGEILLLKYGNWSSNFRGLLLNIQWCFIKTRKQWFAHPIECCTI